MEQKRLGDIATYINGYAFKPEDRGSTGLPIIRIQDLTGNAYDLGFYDGKYPEKIEINDGDVLISWSASLGVYIWNRGKGLLNQHIFKVVFDKCEVNKQYFVFAVKYKLKEMELKTHGATMKHIVKKDFDNTVIPFPTVEKQADIAYILSKIESIVEFRKQELQQLDDLIKARFVEMFGDMYLNSKGWPEAKLESMADVVSGITKGRKTKAEDLTEVPYMAVSNVKDGYIDWTTVKTIEATQQEIEQYRLLADDVLMTEGGDPDKVGRGAIIKEPLENCIHQNHIFRVRLDESMILPEFFAEYLQHQRSKRYFLGCAKQTTGIASINMTQLRALPVLMPPLSKQEEFVLFKAQVNKSKVAVQKALDETQLLFDSLMQEYFG
ncbi:type I restriction endonuclease subunit S [Blautia sp. AF34-10]|uniref:restriction endonuclease subunit S n=1 Tax=Blautia sp. AF34-10 TaxID=2292968 RepID=UPI000E5C9A84|nr:restriction endonuclease subunit S [Blautia sp. AF34-10]RHP36927.1 type I restriction endonuclease subunit S [Blautia sp. AF34-10]